MEDRVGNDIGCFDGWPVSDSFQLVEVGLRAPGLDAIGHGFEGDGIVQAPDHRHRGAVEACEGSDPPIVELLTLKEILDRLTTTCSSSIHFVVCSQVEQDALLFRNLEHQRQPVAVGDAHRMDAGERSAERMQLELGLERIAG